MTEELLIFVGYSDDAKSEALAIRDLEPRLQNTLNRLNEVSNLPSKYAVLKIFNWDYDAKLGVGGQSYAISPQLERAAVTIFVFKERVGHVTWKELTECRERKEENRVPLITLFPKNPPNLEQMNLLEVADAWSDLLRKKKELTEDWCDDNSRSVTPLETYHDLEHLKQILFKRLEDILPSLIRAENNRRDGSESSQSILHAEVTGLDRITDQTEYSSQAVQHYRSLIRPEVSLRFPPELSDTEFLSKTGYLRDGRLTLAGILLFINQPLKVIPSAVIRCTKYDGITKAAERTRRDCSGSLLSQILEARDFIVENTGSRERPVESSMRSHQVYQYPMVCVREVLANAACHRDYDDLNRLTYVNIYEDRIEIKSSGSWVNATLPKGQTVPLRQLVSESVQRNMRLAHAVASVNMMEMEGSGIPSSIQDCIEQEAPEPNVVERDGYVVVTIYPKPDWDSGQRHLAERNIDSKPPATPTGVPLNIVPRPPVVGFVSRRDTEGRDLLKRLKEELAPEKNQLVTLCGAGGVGKTTLAAESMRELSERFAQRIAWVSADGRADFTISTLLDEIAGQLGHPEVRPLMLEQKEEQLRALVAAAPTLIVLDNFETIGEAERARCVDWLAHRTSCSAIITSRDLVPYTLPVNVAAMSISEAQEFVRRLIGQARHPQSFKGLKHEEIISAADRNPLVLQWITKQIDLAKQPHTVLAELVQGKGDAAERVFGRSFNLLNDDGRAALLGLSLFVPSASRPALAEVAGFGADAARLDAAVAQLIDLWLANPTERNERLTVEGLTRELSQNLLSADARANEFRQRFVAYFQRYAQAHTQATPEDYDALESAKDNILCALDMAYGLYNWSSVTRLMDSVYDLLTMRGYWDEAIRYGEQALKAAHNLRDRMAIARFAHNTAVTLQNRGELEEARRLYNESLEIKNSLDNQSGIAMTLHNLAAIAHDQGEFEEARRLYDESLKINKKFGNQSVIAMTLHQLGRLAQDQGEFEEARRLYNESLEINKRLGNRSVIANTLHELGSLAQEQGNLPAARRLYNESLEISQRLGDQSGTAGILNSLGMLAEMEGNKLEAAKLWREALNIFERLKSPYAEESRRNLFRLEE